MKRITLTKQIAFAGLALWLAMVACGQFTTPLGDVRSESQSVNLDSATSARIQVEFAAGELTVQGGAENLMDADFRYNVDEWQPQVRYSENGAQGELIVSQPKRSRPVGAGLINEWTLLLKNDVPLDLSIRAGAATVT